jgi:rhodanese-related sulfurtransferase
MNVKEISPQEAFELANSGTIFVDVREKNETDSLSYDLKEILYLPLSDFQNTALTHLPSDKNQAIILACRSGGRSMRAAQFLASAGYTNLYNLSGGILEWASLSLPHKNN